MKTPEQKFGHSHRVITKRGIRAMPEATRPAPPKAISCQPIDCPMMTSMRPPKNIGANITIATAVAIKMIAYTPAAIFSKISICSTSIFEIFFACIKNVFLNLSTNIFLISLDLFLHL